ncbi:hypothetical protein LVJ59_17655 [Microbacterium sp. KKR3/1]|uniref:hypothetical protein n=1 Tax=Microbacterium sp. KKR3/1 TaxID=2904241 RepID=UPI001E50560D|nr:hypothetical protein [Microbacterium sp. KKR3/1]MCE0510876.1 hypothetical protein [Microbacterium sp. KKR3/1]
MTRNEWFRWFAWHPVWTYDRGWRWLRFVWRRHVPPILGVRGAVWTFDHRVSKGGDS